MFENQGEKLIKLAKVLFYIGAVGSVVGGLSMIVLGIVFKSSTLAVLGVFSPVVGVFIAWFTYLVLSGYGKLIVNSDRVADRLAPLGQGYGAPAGYQRSAAYPVPDPQGYQHSPSKHRSAPAAPKKPEAPEAKSEAGAYFDDFTDVVCPKCGERLSIPSSEFDAGAMLTCPYCDSQFPASALSKRG